VLTETAAALVVNVYHLAALFYVNPIWRRRRRGREGRRKERRVKNEKSATRILSTSLIGTGILVALL
jgi:hypothetical protein